MRASFVIFALFAVAGCGAPDTVGESQDDLRKKKCHSNADCTATQFCDTESKSSCNATGVCTSRGITLFCSTLYAPVCGCDGKTYSSKCVAHKAGVSADYDGPCFCDFVDTD